jgi:predicted nuclease of predicted toxin-antitoxin system
LRLLLDEGLSPRVGDLVADAGHDAAHARDLGDNRLRIRSLPSEPA